MPGKRTLNVKKLVKKMARERVGPVPTTRPIEPKVKRNPKHKKDLRGQTESE